MLDFQKLTLDDIEKIKPYFLYSSNRTCDNTVGGTFMWRDYFNTEYALWSDTVVFKAKLDYYGGAAAFAYPLGKNVQDCIGEIIEYCGYMGLPVIICKLTQEELPFFKEAYSGARIVQERDWSDYLYNACDLINLSGRRYHGQRNHINYFKRTYSNFCFEVISGHNICDVIDFFRSIMHAQPEDSSDIYIEDQLKTLEVLENFSRYGLLGGLIRIGGKVAAFSVGEVLGNVLFVHIEKADLAYRGIYQVINNEFAKHFASAGVAFINREDDSGDPGLRMAKQSYHPAEMIDKYIAEIV